MTLELDTGKEAESGLVKKLTPELPPMMPREELVARAHLLMADVLVAQGLKEKAIEYLDSNSAKIVGEELQVQKALTQAETMLDLLALDQAEDLLAGLDDSTLANNPHFLLLRGILKKQKNTRFISNQVNTVPSDTLALIERSIAISEEQKQLTQSAVARTYLGQMYLDSDPAKALNYLEKAYEQASIVGSVAIQGKALQAMARAYTKLNDFEHALTNFEQAAQLFFRNNQMSAYGNTLVFVALTKEKQAEHASTKQEKRQYSEEARHIYERAISEMEKIEAGRPILEKNLYRLYGKFLLSTDVDKATNYLILAESLLKPNSPLSAELEQLLSAAIARTI